MPGFGWGDGSVGKASGIAAAAAGLLLLGSAAAAEETADVGAMAEVQRTVYGAPPQGSQMVKRLGDPVIFRETLETLDNSGALVRFIDDSKLTIGARSKVVIDAFVFDPAKAEGNALIQISVGTLRWVTGGMPKGKTVIETPTATLTLRGTDVIVHVHPDGTTDTTVNEGDVDAHNKITNTNTDLGPGQGAKLGNDGNSNFTDPNDPDPPADENQQANQDPPEHRRADQDPNHTFHDQQANERANQSGPPSGGDEGEGEGEGEGDEDGGDDEGCEGDCGTNN
jgi:hypothetical protein